MNTTITIAYMDNFRVIYTIWLREVRKFLRGRSQLVIAFCQPMVWLFIFGTLMRYSIGNSIPNYQEYIFPGIIAQSMLFTAMFMGITLIWDREFGFLKEVLVSPVSRLTLFIGKILGLSTDVMIQGLIMFPFALVIGMRVSLISFVEALPVMLLITIGLVSIGLSFASVMKSLEGFGMIQTFINLPLFFLSGSLFPLSSVPLSLRWVTDIDPLTYGVDALRTIMMGNVWTPLYPIYIDLGYLLAFDVLLIAIGTYLFGRTE